MWYPVFVVFEQSQGTEMLFSRKTIRKANTASTGIPRLLYKDLLVKAWTHVSMTLITWGYISFRFSVSCWYLTSSSTHLFPRIHDAACHDGPDLHNAVFGIYSIGNLMSVLARRQRVAKCESLGNSQLDCGRKVNCNCSPGFPMP